ncbi:MAG: 3-hydroxyacyl-ACP dehydratase FabZ [Bacillota bacterium]
MKQTRLSDNENCLSANDGSGHDNGNLKRIKEILPHRDPFLFLTRIISIEQGKSAVAEFDIPQDHLFFKGHFPQEPIFPGVIILEMMAQTGALAILCDTGLKGKVAYLAGVESARFRRPVRPGQTLRAEVTIEGIRMNIGRANGKAFADGKEAAVAKVVFGLPV